MPMTDPVAQAPHINAIEIVVDLLAQVESDDAPGAFYDRLCEAICRVTSMDRAVLFRYDAPVRRVTAAGVHGLDISQFSDFLFNPDTTPIARQALVEDRVIEIPEDASSLLPERYAGLVDDTVLVCTPMIASGRWVGIVLSDRPRSAGPLGDDERHLLWTLGKTAALAAIARIATAQVERSRQLEQRIDLAREIHDGVVQRLFGVSLVLASGQTMDAETQARCAEEVQAALGDLRTAVQRPLGRPSRASAASLRDELTHLRAAAAVDPEGAQLHVEDATSAMDRLEPATADVARSVLVEAVRNARKHAQPTRIDVKLVESDDALVLEVINDGVPAAGARPAAAVSGMGLRLSAFEALQLGGVVEFGRRDGGRWCVRLVVPRES
ncbi:MAG: putative signal transduction histidine kinase [Solirubrobacterales bacterium]|nr:putative signal transduction histidine kinase [Solirubrobacterales bacterium]